MNEKLINRIDMLDTVHLSLKSQNEGEYETANLFYAATHIIHLLYEGRYDNIKLTSKQMMKDVKYILQMLENAFEMTSNVLFQESIQEVNEDEMFI